MSVPQLEAPLTDTRLSVPAPFASAGRQRQRTFFASRNDHCPYNFAVPSKDRDRRRAERYPTASIPVQLSDVNGELIDLSLSGAAVIHRSPVRPGTPCTLIFPSHGGFYIPCQVLRSVVQVRRGEKSSEYVFRSAIQFSPIPPEKR